MKNHNIRYAFAFVAGFALCASGCKKGGPGPVELGAVKSLGSISVKVPKGWQESPPKNNMRRAQWTVGSGDKTAELVVFYFGGGGGSIQANVDRWLGQFEQPDGKPTKEVAEVSEETLAGLKTTRVEAGGRYVARVRPGAEERHNKADQHMFAAIVEAPDGPYFFKMVGPSETVKAAQAGFDAMLGSLAKTGGKAAGAAKHPDPDEIKKAEEEKKKKEERARRLAERKKKAEEAAKKELERWTDDMHKKAKELVGKEYKNSKAALEAILASPHRVPGNSERDKYRHPLETLTFLGIEQGMTVIEAGAGSGWYTEVLGPFVAKKGKLLVVTYDPDGPEDSFYTLFGRNVKTFLAKSPEMFGTAELVPIKSQGSIPQLASDGTVDMVLAFREMHNWHRGGFLEKYIAAAHKALKPGGVFGVVQHRAKAGADAAKSAQKGYLPEDWLIEQFEAAGFELAGKSDINANPKDTKDWENGVWTLPPVLTNGDEDRDKYLAIGESDRMTLKFVKKK